MKKFILPVINLISMVLAGVIFGLGANTAVEFKPTGAGAGNWYQLVWELSEKPNLFGLIGFFLLCVGAFALLVTLLPFKARKYVVLVVGLMLVGAGVMFFLSPRAVYGYEVVKNANCIGRNYVRTDSLIAMMILAFVAGGLEILGAVVVLLPEKK